MTFSYKTITLRTGFLPAIFLMLYNCCVKGSCSHLLKSERRRGQYVSDHCFASSIFGSEAVFSGRTGSSVTSSIEHLHAIVSLVSSAIVKQTRPVGNANGERRTKTKERQKMPQPSDSQKSQLASNPNATPVKTFSVPVEQATIGR